MNHPTPSGDDAVVYLIDDDPGMLRSMSQMLSVAKLPAMGFTSAEAFLAQYQPSRPGCLVLDLRMPGMSGIDLLRLLRERDVPLPIIVITGHGDVPTAVTAMKLGACEFMEKPFDPRVFIERTRRMLADEAASRGRNRERQEVRDRLGVLTAREQEVVRHLVAGLSNKQIAREMGISIKTVEHHRAHIMSKSNATNAADLVRLGVIAWGE